ncbi:hypothetical protein M408DRAFT_329810, partial [Serendipita vermifera MAFF 305830]
MHARTRPPVFQMRLFAFCSGMWRRGRASYSAGGFRSPDSTDQVDDPSQARARRPRHNRRFAFRSKFRSQRVSWAVYGLPVFPNRRR